ncbi:MAG TPA: LysR substrate-binding domain-containing protein [Kofleriaceae bacterium]
MSLNARQIEVFRAIMITGSISAASRLLHVSQPAVSRVLAYMEQRLGYPLFQRIKSRLHPTVEGKELFREIEQVYRGIQRVNERARELGERRSGVLHLVGGPSLGYQLIPAAIARFRGKHDQVKVTFQALTLPSLLDALIQQRAELGLSMFPVEHPNVDSTPLCHGTVVCVFPSGHPLSKVATVKISDIIAHPLVSYPHGTPFGNVVESIFAVAEIAKPVAIEVASPQEACSVVEAGGGVALVDTFSMNSRLGHGLDSRPINDSPSLTANLLRLKEEPLSRLASAFCETLREITSEFGYAPAEESGSEKIDAIVM